MAKVSWNAIVEISHGTGLNPYVIYKTLMGICEDGKSADKAFADAIEDENMYGIRPDIVADRKRHAKHILNRYNIKISDYTIETGEVEKRRKIPDFMKL